MVTKCRKFPVADFEIAEYVHIRFNSALQYLEELNPLLNKFDAPEKRFLTWLLIRRWRAQGRAEWIGYLHGANWSA